MQRATQILKEKERDSEGLSRPCSEALDSIKSDFEHSIERQKGTIEAFGRLLNNLKDDLHEVKSRGEMLQLDPQRGKLDHRSNQINKIRNVIQLQKPVIDYSFSGTDFLVVKECKTFDETVKVCRDLKNALRTD